MSQPSSQPSSTPRAPSWNVEPEHVVIACRYALDERIVDPPVAFPKQRAKGKKELWERFLSVIKGDPNAKPKPFLGAAEEMRRSKDKYLLPWAEFLEKNLTIQTLEQMIGTHEFAGKGAVVKLKWKGGSMAEKMQSIDVTYRAATGEGKKDAPVAPVVAFGTKTLPEDPVAELGFNPKTLLMITVVKDQLVAIKRGKDDGKNQDYFGNLNLIMRRTRIAFWPIARARPLERG